MSQQQKLSKKHISTEDISDIYTHERNRRVLFIIPAVPTGHWAGLTGLRRKCLRVCSRCLCIGGVVN